MNHTKTEKAVMFTIDRLPFTLRSLFTVHHGKRITENVLKTENRKQLMASEGGA